MKITYGCDCICTNHTYCKAIPAAFLIERSGKQMKVCTRCDLTSDKKIARLFDSSTLMKEFFDYDPLGGFCVEGFSKMTEEEFLDYLAERK